jgi:iron complex outermembrane receptor protein
MKLVSAIASAGLGASASLGAVAAFAQSASAPQAAPGVLEEIIVTAQRREETVQKSSLSIQVLSDDELWQAGVVRASDLNRVVPGIQVAGGGNAAQIYIRGVGDFAASPLSNPAVAVNVDGVYISRPQGVNSSFYDLARLEVLRGPQGTLYGRNASGGALNLVTNRPSLDSMNGYVSVGLGNYSLVEAQGAINVPLSDTVAIRAAANVVQRDGYLSDDTDDEDTTAGRVRLLWQPSEALSLLLNADVAEEKGKGPGYVQLPRPSGTDPWLSGSSPQSNGILAGTPPIGFLVAPIGTDTFRDNTFWNVSAELNWDFGPATLTVIPAFRDADISERNYPAGLRNTIPESSSEQTTLEVRLGNASDQLKWVVGAYYYKEEQEAEQQIFQGILQDNVISYTPDSKSYAAFGEATFSVTERLRLIAGARYTEEDKSVEGTIYTNSPVAAPPGAPLPFLLEVFGGDESFSDTTWKAGLEYDVTPDNMLFATAGTGFKAGGFNQTVAPMDTFDPEELTAYQLGSRNRFADGRVQLNAEVYYWDYKDQQIGHVVFDPVGNINFVTDNAGQATIQGANIDLVAAITDNDRVELFVEYNDTEYDEFTYETAYSIFGAPIFNPASTACPFSAPFPGPSFGTLLTTIDCSGQELPRAPQWVASAAYEHTFRFGNGSSVSARVSGQYTDARWLNFEYVATERADSNEVYNLDLTYVSPHGNWTISAFVHNLDDEAVYTGGGEQGFAPPLVYATIGAPRTYGARLQYAFD